MGKSDRERWNKKFKEKEFVLGKEANLFLRRHVHLLPRGKALDIATGEGRNAVYLARHGFDVDAVDISKIALSKAKILAGENRVKVRFLLADLDTYPIEKGRYDLISDFYFLDRRLIPRIKKGVKKGGRVIFETYLAEPRSLRTEDPSNPAYLLRPNELLRLFKEFRILFYREGIFKERGERKAIASLIGEKI